MTFHFNFNKAIEKDNFLWTTTLVILTVGSDEDSLEGNGQGSRARSSSKSHEEGLKESSHVEERIFATDDEVHQHESEKEVNCKTSNNRQHVETQAGNSAYQIIYGNYLTNNEEDNTNWSVPILKRKKTSF